MHWLLKNHILRSWQSVSQPCASCLFFCLHLNNYSTSMAWFNGSLMLSTIHKKSCTINLLNIPPSPCLFLLFITCCLYKLAHSLMSTLAVVFSHYLWQRVSFVFEDHLSNQAQKCCSDTYSPWKQCNKVGVPWTHTDAMSQFGNLSCTRGRSHLVSCINNNKRSFHGTSSVLSNNCDLSEASGNSLVCSASSRCLFFSSLQIIHSSTPHYLDL